jgi:hypothetical protein
MKTKMNRLLCALLLIIPAAAADADGELVGH